MHVQGVAIGAGSFNPAGKKVGPKPVTADAPIAEAIAANPSKQKGVVRLLRAGHFKGVADARLRINFHEEIAQLGSQSLSNVFQEALDSFFDELDAGFASFIDGVSATANQAASATELFSQFKSTINDLAQAFLNDGGQHFGSVAIQFQSEFDSFSVELEIRIASVPESTEAVVEDVPESTDSFFDQFRQAFTEQLDRLVESLDALATVLPEVSAPNGNGKAYAKFLEILDGLNTPASSSESESLLQDLLA